jgi:hypothetical protein
MKTLGALLAASALLAAGCTVVKIGKGDTNTITHKAGPGIAQDLANRACRKAGQQSAEILSTVNEDAKLPEGTGRQLTTFRCSASAQPPPQ